MFCKKLEDLLNGEIETIAKVTGFHQRRSGKIDPWIFLDIVLLLYKDHKEDSLEILCLAIKNKYGIEISKQGLNERFSDKASDFIEEVLKYLLEVQLKVPLHLTACLDNFTKVKIKDSTEFKGYSKNQEAYKGFGGPGTASCFQVQLELDLKTGKVEDLCLTSAVHSDQADARETIDKIEAGDLIIRDLGYVSQYMLNTIDQQEAFYLNKIKRNIHLFTESFQEVKYGKVYRKMRSHQLALYEERLYVGKQTDHVSRVIFTIVPEKVYKQRIKELQISRKDKAISKEDRARARLNVLVTNATAEALPSLIAVDLYRIRWQIELEFKSWKSTARLASLKDTKTCRTECYILGKLIWLLLTNQAKILLSHVKKFPTGISPIKFGKVAKLKKEAIGKITAETIFSFINSMLAVPEKSLKRESKKTNKNAGNYLGITGG